MEITDLLVRIQATLTRMMGAYSGNGRIKQLFQQLQYLMESQRSTCSTVNDLDEALKPPEACAPPPGPRSLASPDLYKLLNDLLTEWDPENREQAPSSSTFSIISPAPADGLEMLREQHAELQVLLAAKEQLGGPLEGLNIYEQKRMDIARLLRETWSKDIARYARPQPILQSEWVCHSEAKPHSDVNFNPFAIVSRPDSEHDEATWKTLPNSKMPAHLGGNRAIAIAKYCLNSAVLSNDLGAMFSAEVGDETGITRAVTEGDEVAVASILAGFNRPLDIPIATAIQNAMRVAVGQGRSGIVRMLLDSNPWGQDFAVQPDTLNASTLLDLAASKGHVDVVGLLLASNHTSTLGHNQFVSKTLPEHAMNAIRMAAQNGHLHTAQALVKAIAESQTKLDLLNTTLFIAIKARRDAIARYILNAGADINARSRNPNDPPSPLACAIQRGLHDSVIQFMANAGANLEVQDDAQRTPLFIAAKDGQRLKSVLALLDHGANLEHRDGNGYTFLHIAAGTWDPVCLKKLLGRSDVQRLLLVTNKEGKIPEQVAASASESSADKSEQISMLKRFSELPPASTA